MEIGRKNNPTAYKIANFWYFIIAKYCKIIAYISYQISQKSTFFGIINRQWNKSVCFAKVNSTAQIPYVSVKSISKIGVVVNGASVAKAAYPMSLPYVLGIR